MKSTSLLIISLAIVTARDVRPSRLSPQEDETDNYNPFNFGPSEDERPLNPNYDEGRQRSGRQHPSSLGIPFVDAAISSRDGDDAQSDVSPLDFDEFFKTYFGLTFSNLMNKTVYKTQLQDIPPQDTYSNREIEDLNGNKILVEETIHKEEESTDSEGCTHKYRYKVVQVVPFNGQNGNEDILKARFGSDYYPSNADSFPGDSSHSEDISQLESDSYIGNNDSLREKRSIDGRDADIVFPAEEVNRFPHSMVNTMNENVRAANGNKVSRSYVYKDMDGSSYLYSVNHNAIEDKDRKDLDNEDKGVHRRENDADTVGPIRPPDLSRDTHVNPDGSSSSNQGISQVNPDAEIFDLSLVIKEMEERANNP